MSGQNYICPFCLDVDFDRKGLANHLNGSCDEYDKALDDFREEMRANHERVLLNLEAKWQSFLAKKHPDANGLSFECAPGSMRNEFQEWRKG